ncbi:MAG: hypothetical protein EBY39_07465 [Flavobacteriia bacterium]|nr:hypothetical protein [Flavobacteriia bacterium]
MSETNTSEPGDTNLNWQHPDLGYLDDDDPRIERFKVHFINQKNMEESDEWDGEERLISTGTESFLEGLGVDVDSAVADVYGACQRYDQAIKDGVSPNPDDEANCQDVLDGVLKDAFDKARRTATEEDVERAKNAEPPIDLEVGDVILDVKELKKSGWPPPADVINSGNPGGSGIRASLDNDASDCDKGVLAAAEESEPPPFIVYPEYCFS